MGKFDEEIAAAPSDEDDAPLPAAFSEDALARAWCDRHAVNWRYVAPWNGWMKWRGDVWAQDFTAEYFDISRNITREALMWPGASDLTKSDRLRLCSARTAAATLQFVKSDRHIAATVEQWDQQQMLLGVPGGTIDLQTQKLRPSSRDHYITKRTTVSPSSASPVRWLQFLSEVTSDDSDLVHYLQRFAGYCLTASTREHAFAFLYGTGANGKTTFLQVLLGILGEYGLTTGMETLAESKGERHTTELARLRGARLVATEETSSGSRWNEARIKRLTGGGRITARFMRQDDFEFEPHFKLLIAGNHKPSLRADEAMKRRVHLIPFTVTIPEHSRDKELSTKLREEWPQILGWMLDGCSEWQRIGLSPGERIREASEKYLKSNDMLGDWIAERCEITDATQLYDGKSLYQDFLRWCEENGETPWKRRGWSDAMIDAGFEQDRSKVTRGFRGIRLALSASPAQSYDYNEK